MRDLLIDSPNVRFALCAMRMVHFDAYDKSGTPYIEHPMALASCMDPPTEQCVALLHDAIEDAEHPEAVRAQIRDSFPPEVYEPVETLTRPAGVTYAAYIEQVALCPIATKVKLADLAHNLNTDRLAPKQRAAHASLAKRYERAAVYLLEQHPKYAGFYQECIQRFAVQYGSSNGA